MADYRRHYEERPQRHERGGPDRAGREPRTWLGDDKARQHRGNDERDDRFPYGGDRQAHHDEWRTMPDGMREDRASRWEAPRDDRDDSGYGYAGASMGGYRTDDRGYHDRYRADRYRDEEPGSRYRDEGRHIAADNERPRRDLEAAASEYYRAAREQRDDFVRWEAQSPGADRDEGNGGRDTAPPWARREHGGYWRQYEASRPHFSGRGPKDYRRSDERVREEVCDSMTDDPVLDASEIVVAVANGEVTLSGSVTSRDQKRRAEDVAERISGVKDVTNQLRVVREASGYAHTASQPVSQSGNGTPSKSTSRTST